MSDDGQSALLCYRFAELEHSTEQTLHEEFGMSLGDQITANLPYLRRYARALAGSQAAGDKLVEETLRKVLADPQLKATLSEGRVPLFRAFSSIWANAENSHSEEKSAGQERTAQYRLSKVTPLHRQALLLNALEDFTTIQVAEILGVSANSAEDLVSEAIKEIDAEARTSVLIIEDEPLISLQLEELTRSLGHEVFGTAATRTQAQEAVASGKPGLVLADIQLADGSSGLDAVDDILSLGEVPVVFVTAYPERLLTGDRPEPTYLVTKPFREDVLRAAISQALFFDPSGTSPS